MQLLCNRDFRVEHPENAHHNEGFPIGLFDGTSTKSAFFVEVDYFWIARYVPETRLQFSDILGYS